MRSWKRVAVQKSLAGIGPARLASRNDPNVSRDALELIAQAGTGVFATLMEIMAILPS